MSIQLKINYGVIIINDTTSQDSKKFDEVWKSSDSEEYLAICRKEVSLDSSTTFDTLNYLFKDIQENFIFMNLQVTSPIRKTEHIINAFDSFVDCDHLVSYRLNKSLQL